MLHIFLIVYCSSTREQHVNYNRMRVSMTVIEKLYLLISICCKGQTMATLLGLRSIRRMTKAATNSLTGLTS